MRRSRITSVLLVVLLVAMINLPIVQISWTDWRVESQGVDVRAEVIEVNRLPPVDDPHYVLVDLEFVEKLPELVSLDGMGEDAALDGLCDRAPALRLHRRLITCTNSTPPLICSTSS